MNCRKKQQKGRKMIYYLAPLEGITGYVYRNAYEKYFHNTEKYFTPFLSPTQNKKLTPREKQDVLPEHNKNMYVVPQILTNNSEYFLDTVEKLKDFGYKEVNLNLGCPSGTVVTKKKGAGFLSEPLMLQRFLDEIYQKSDIKISIKTRIGIDDVEEFQDLLHIFNQFPLEELIVHPRLQIDFYKGIPRYESYQLAMEKSKHSLCYNGDIWKKEDFIFCSNQFAGTEKWMLGRGIIGNPFLIEQIEGTGEIDKKKWKQFHDDIFHGYEEIMSGDRNVLFKMKELWFYMGKQFEEYKKELKTIKKTTSIVEYQAAVRSILL